MGRPCRHSFLRGGPPFDQRHGHADHHHNDDFHHSRDMNPKHDMHHHDHPGKHVMILDHMMHPHNQESERRWKDSFYSNTNSASSSHDGLDGWYAGNQSHDGWHASPYVMDETEDGDSLDESSEDGEKADNSDSDHENLSNEFLSVDSMAVERMEVVKEDGMIPGLP